MNENIPKEITLKVGENTTVKFKGMATAGYQWNFSIDKNKDHVAISKDYENEDDKKAGASAEEEFTITAKKTGTVIIAFTQQRSWEKATDALNEKKIKVIIE